MKASFYSFTLLLLGWLISFTSCNDDKQNDLLKPVVVFQTKEYSIPSGDSAKIIPTVTNRDNCTYSWKTEGNEISTDSVLNFKRIEPKKYAIQLTVTNSYGSSEASCMIEVTELPPYYNSILILDSGSRGDMGGTKKSGQLLAIKANGEYVENVLEATNVTLGYECVAPSLFDNKIYILSDAGNTDFDKAEITIMDAVTMKLEKTLSFNVGGFMDRAKSITVINDQKAYIGVSDDKLYTFDLATGKKGDALEGEFSSSLIKTDKKIYGIFSGFRKSQLRAIDPLTDEVATTEINDQIQYFMAGHNNTLLFITESMMDFNGAQNLVCYSTETNSIIGETQKLPVGAHQGGAYAVASPSDDVIFYCKHRDKGTIYRYNYKTQQGEEFTKIDKVTYLRMLIHPTDHKLYITYKVENRVSDFRTLVFDVNSKVPASPLNGGYDHTAFQLDYLFVNTAK